jgi:hypothetical protein
VKQVPLRLGRGGKVIGVAEVDEEKGKVRATVTDPVAAAELAASLSGDAGSFSIVPAAPRDREPSIEDRPSHEEGRRNQLRGTCGGTRWRYVGGDCMGWWEVCKGCEACQ